jgi:hypothetical protein
MRPRPSLVVAAASGLCGLVVGLMLGRPSTAQAPALATPNLQAGRYQVSVTGNSSPFVVVIDTMTGKCWGRYPKITKAPWEEIGTPP